MTELASKDIDLIEIVRHLEEAACSAGHTSAGHTSAGRTSAGLNLASHTPVFPAGASFAERLAGRARSLAAEWNLGQQVAHARRLLGLTAGVLVALFAILGGTAALQAFPDSGRPVNFFWLLLVLLGLHLLTLLLWLAGLLSMRGRPDEQPTLRALRRGMRLLAARLPAAAIPQSAEAVAATSEVTRAWLQVHLRGWPGVWRVSRIVHACWLAWLLGGFLVIVLMLGARQYDFVWETTILDEAAFQTLTRGLGAAPDLLGFPVPAAEAVRLSRGGGPAMVAAPFREQWAGLLLGSLLLYGVAPRLLILILCRWLGMRAASHARLDLTLPYYVGLRQTLDPPTLALAPEGSDLAPSDARPPEPSRTSRRPPQEACWVALEVDGGVSWPPPGVADDQDLGRIDDRRSQQSLLETLATRRCAALVAVSELRRTADRGLTRLLGELGNGVGPAGLWLVLLATASESASQDGRDKLSAWYALAARCGIPDTQVLILGPLAETTDA